MACINMFNDHQAAGFCGAPPPISPRISFSNDFAVEPPPPPQQRSAAPPDTNFEFAVGGRPMIAADELFFKGRMLPLRDTCPTPGAATGRITTLRDELRGEGDEWSRPPKGSPRWKEFLGFRRAYCGSSGRKSDKGDQRSSSAGGESTAGPTGKFAQEVKGNGGARASDEDEDQIDQLQY
ncbi:hypothetical protein KFK09_013246 [Dendrobium nobile]|uniref:Uncharacterized protein n=1 Tax=Dendrobium nobile TaxID=94219 RepID=A0A8T3B8G2_DENNO|nr:hypothetical protein KFK09_013246 [Dendrobium nobile]